ncbi:uncharacterized protein LOC130130571 [Lampris incognitus]|uniref:uncharacterized protein LOC130130571 n=1 Tax=Lampris incognitus TaxID=2546036 RepID=UPI0024B5C556|nr:uncharacterized protein LOC130130571 [Lampris incognitus]
MTPSGRLARAAASREAVARRGGTRAGLLCWSLVCLASAAAAQSGETLPPPSLNLSLTDGFFPTFSWAPLPPQYKASKCVYVITKNGDPALQLPATYASYTFRVTMEGGRVNFSVQIRCGDKSSAAVVREIDYPELVSQVQCLVHSSRLIRCSWSPSKHVRDLGLFLLRDEEVVPYECPAYESSEGVRTGCRLRGGDLGAIYLMFNGDSERHARQKHLHDTPSQQRPPPLNWTVAVETDNITISWRPPDVMEPHCWGYKIKYTACDEEQVKEVGVGVNSAQLTYLPHCRYRISIKATIDTCGTGETPWSEVKEFGKDKDPYAGLYIAAAIVPVICITLAALALVCFRKHQEQIIPKVPCPPESIKSMLDNNNMSTIGSLYTPPKEEDDVSITLVTERQLS